MKSKILTLFFLALILSCQQKEKVSEKTEPIQSIKKLTLIRDIYQLKNYATSYSPDKIDFSDNKMLNRFDVNYIYNDPKFKDEESLRQHITNVLLLKQYLYHISKYNQGYDLLTMRNAQAKFVIDHFIAVNNINPNLEFLNSGYPYTLLKEKPSDDTEVKNLIKAISEQEKRIVKQ